MESPFFDLGRRECIRAECPATETSVLPDGYPSGMGRIQPLRVEIGRGRPTSDCWTLHRVGARDHRSVLTNDSQSP